MTCQTIKNAPTIQQAQSEVGFIKNRENGIIEQAVQQSEIADLLMPFSRKADFRLTFSLGYRELLTTFYEDDIIYSDNIITALSIAIDSQAYNLQTILETMNLEYNPIQNIDIGEQIVTTTTVSANKIYDNVSISKNISEISRDTNDTINSGKQKENVSETITDEKGVYTETNTETQNLGIIEKAITTLTTQGAQVNSGSNTLTHAAYNTANYSPKDKTSTQDNIGERIDQENVTDQTNPIKNTITEDKTVPLHTDTITKNNTINRDSVTDTKQSTFTQNPYTEDTKTAERNDKEDEKRNDNKDRNIKGLQGKSAQELILIQRQLADIDIVGLLCQITIDTICSGFIKAW